MCHYVSYCVPVTHMLINADLCLIMLIYNRAKGVLLTDCRKKELAHMMQALLSLSILRMELCFIVKKNYASRFSARLW